MSQFLGEEYNYEGGVARPDEAAYFKEVTRAGSPAPDFTLPTSAGHDVTLSRLPGNPMDTELGSITGPPCRADLPLLVPVPRDRAAQLACLPW